jgi:hypothetical protein
MKLRFLNHSKCTFQPTSRFRIMFLESGGHDGNSDFLCPFFEDQARRSNTATPAKDLFSAPRVLKKSQRLFLIKVLLFSFRVGARSGLYGAQLFGLELPSSYAQLRVLTLVKPLLHDNCRGHRHQNTQHNVPDSQLSQPCDNPISTLT